MTVSPDVSPGQHDDYEEEFGADQSNAAVFAGDTSLVRLAIVALDGWRWFIGIPIALAFLVSLISLALPARYTTTVSFRPVATAANLGQLAGLASQFGVALPGSDPAASGDFYADLVRTPQLLSRLALARYAVEDDGDTLRGTFIDLYEVSERTPGRTLFEAIRILNEKILTVQPKRTTSVVTVSIETWWPDLSREMAEELLRLLDEFNVTTRQYQADAEYRFMEQRLDTARMELLEAENRAEAFLQANREFRGDPQLLFQYDRLQRDVTTRQTVYTTLLQGVEQMRIEAVRNTPSISIIERPTQPLRPDRRHLVQKGLLSLTLGGILSLIIVFAKEFGRGTKARRGHSVAELRSQWASTRGEMLALLARTRRSARDRSDH